MGFARFMASGTGRGLRVLVGLALVLLGLFVVGGAGGWALAVVGLVPLAAGAFDVCLFTPLFGLPFKGEDIRVTLPR